MFSLRRHIAIQSECNTDCGLCHAIGCLHPHQRDVDEVREELDLALISLSEFVVFPPNALEHPEIETIAALIHERGLCPIFRTRASQYEAGSLELISRLADRGARLELLMDRPSNPEVIDEIVALRKSRLRSLTPVLIPTRREDLSIVLDAIPLELRRDLEVLPLLNSDSRDQFLDSDELNEWLEKTQAAGFRLKPYEEFDRTHPEASPEFNQPGEFEILCSHRKNENAIQLSVIVPFQSVDHFLTRTVNSFVRQNSSATEFELILVKDGFENNGSAERALKTLITRVDMNWSVLSLPAAYTPDTQIRAGLAMNNGALFGVGTKVAFLEAGIIAGPDWVANAIAASASGPTAYQPCLVPSDSADAKTRPTPDVPRELTLLDARPQRSGRHGQVDWRVLRTSCLVMPMKDFFEVGGFPRVFLSRSLETPALAWKLARLGKAIPIRDSGLDRLTEFDERLKHPAPPKWKFFATSLREMEKLSPSAAALYMMTLDNDVYRCYFEIQDGASLTRVLMRQLSTNRLLRPLLGVAHFSSVVIRSENRLQFLVSSVITGSHQFVIGLRGRRAK